MMSYSLDHKQTLIINEVNRLMNKHILMAMKSIANPDLYTRVELKASKNEAYGDAAIVTWEGNSTEGDIATIVYNIAYAVSDKGTFNKGYILDDVEPLILQYFKLTGEDIQDYHNKVEEI